MTISTTEHSLSEWSRLANEAGNHLVEEDVKCLSFMLAFKEFVGTQVTISQARDFYRKKTS